MRDIVVCATCPFRNRARFRGLADRADRGEWIPCTKSVVPALKNTVAERVAAWANETECGGSRLWRRDRETPAGDDPAMTEEERIAAALRS